MCKKEQKMIQLNCLCNDWKTHRCPVKIIIWTESPKDMYEVWLIDKQGNETVLQTGRQSLLKFAKRIICLVTDCKEGDLECRKKL